MHWTKCHGALFHASTNDMNEINSSVGKYVLHIDFMQVDENMLEN